MLWMILLNPLTDQVTTRRGVSELYPLYHGTEHEYICTVQTELHFRIRERSVSQEKRFTHCILASIHTLTVCVVDDRSID